MEVNPKGEVVHVTPLTTNVQGFHLQVRNVHKLANGNKALMPSRSLTTRRNGSSGNGKTTASSSRSPPSASSANNGLDYTLEPVRKRMLDFITEVLDRYDPDGLELDLIRFQFYLPKGREKKCAPIFTAYNRESATNSRWMKPVPTTAAENCLPRRLIATSLVPASPIESVPGGCEIRTDHRDTEFVPTTAASHLPGTQSRPPPMPAICWLLAGVAIPGW